MPIYEFVCEASESHVFTKLLRMAERDEPQVCSCGSSAKRRITSPHVSIQYPDSTSRKFLSGTEDFRPSNPKEALKALPRGRR